jgi:integrase
MAFLRLFPDSGMRLVRIDQPGGHGRGRRREGGSSYGQGSRPLACPFGNKTGEALDQYMRLRARDPRADGTDALWIGARGAMGTPGIRSVVERRPKQTGIDGVHAHLFRHVFAHKWLGAGNNETDLIRLVGWRTREMVNRDGASADDERARDAYRAHRSPGDRL